MIGSCYGLAPNKRQTIMWATDAEVYWHIYASLGQDELNHQALSSYSGMMAYLQ